MPTIKYRAFLSYSHRDTAWAKWLHKALERDPHDPNIHSHLGDVYAKQGRSEQAAAEWEKSLTEWHRSLPADMEGDKIAEVEKKVGSVKHRVAQKSAPQDTNKQQ